MTTRPRSRRQSLQNRPWRWRTRTTWTKPSSATPWFPALLWAVPPGTRTSDIERHRAGSRNRSSRTDHDRKRARDSCLVHMDTDYVHSTCICSLCVSHRGMLDILFPVLILTELERSIPILLYLRSEVLKCWPVLRPAVLNCPDCSHFIGFPFWTTSSEPIPRRGKKSLTPNARTGRIELRYNRRCKNCRSTQGHIKVYG